MQDPQPSQAKTGAGNAAKKHGLGTKLLAIIGTIFSVLYLINPTGGFLEFIPDNFPIIGNLDEATVTALLIYCLSLLGVRLPFLKHYPKNRQESESEMRDVGPK